MRSSNMYFDQVPVDLVKKITGEQTGTAMPGGMPDQGSRGGESATSSESALVDFAQCSVRPYWPDEMLKYPEWQRSYRDALLETDATRLKERIVLAEAAISDRLRNTSVHTLQADELQAIEDALSSLRVIKAA